VESVAVTTPYNVLGISVDADEETIRAAFRKAAKRYHPDLNPDDPSAGRRLRRLIRARDMLLDPERRLIHAGDNFLWHPSWRAFAKSTGGKSIGGALVAMSLFLMLRYPSPHVSAPVQDAITYASASTDTYASASTDASASDIPDADSAEIKAMRDLRETWATQAPAGAMSKQALHSSLASSHRVLRPRQSRFQMVIAKAATTWQKLASKLQALKRAGT
jgi:curved DNA-binding protein CbpA